jgi:hypothetical protein
VLLVKSVVGLCRRLGAYLVDKVAPSLSVSGVRVTKWSGTGDPSTDFAKLSAALELVEGTDKRRFALIRRHLARIALVQQGGELFDPQIRTYVMDRDLLSKRSVPHVAMGIIHEMTHARLRARGVVTNHSNVERIESVCVAEEIDFAKRLPDSEDLVKLAESKMANPWWDSVEVERRVKDQLDSINAPPWIRWIRRHLIGSG